MKFKDFNLKEYIQSALEELNFSELTPVQEEVIPEAINGRSVIVESQTGTGKTHTFMIPIFQKLDPSINAVQAVITAPSRELASQLHSVALQIAKHCEDNIRVGLYIGGTDKERQIQQLNHQQPHIVVGTPGRILDLANESALLVHTAKIMVIDEADMTMDLGFLDDVNQIASRMPSDLQMMAFSATMSQELEVFLRKYMTGPIVIEIDKKQVLAPEINNYLINVNTRDPKALTYELLTMGYPFLALVFCNTREKVEEMASYLENQGLKVASIHGGIEPRERNRIMRQVRNLDFQYIVATDLAARGIDIPGVSMVINVELPTDLEFFIHRVGRTGRNKIEGDAYTFLYPGDDEKVSKLEDMGVSFKMVDIADGEIKKVKHRHARRDRKGKQVEEYDPEIQKIIGKAKKKPVKPGYKRRMKYEIDQEKRRKARKKRRRSRKK